MKPEAIKGEIKKQMEILHVTRDDLIRATGLSRATFARRMASPGNLTLEELGTICSYLGMEITAKEKKTWRN